MTGKTIGLEEQVAWQGTGFSTVTKLLGVLKSDERRVAVSLELETYELVLTPPLYLTTDVGRKPVPSIVIDWLEEPVKPDSGVSLVMAGVGLVGLGTQLGTPEPVVPEGQGIGFGVQSGKVPVVPDGQGWIGLTVTV